MHTIFYDKDSKRLGLENHIKMWMITINRTFTTKEFLNYIEEFTRQKTPLILKERPILFSLLKHKENIVEKPFTDF